MEKIRQLLLKSGLSEDAASKICESLEDHARQLREHYQNEFTTKLSEVKNACLEETTKHKAELSRRVQIFLETKEEAVQQQLSKQSAERGTAAESKLEKIAALVEGIELNGQPNSALQAEVGKLTGMLKHLKEQKDLAINKASRLQEIADKVLKRNKILEGQIASNGKKPVVESRQRKGNRPNTTRRVLEETVERKHQESQPTNQMRVPITPDSIADLI